MFKQIVTGLLAAATLVPMAASAQDRDGRRDRGERAERRDDRPQRDWQQPGRDRGDRGNARRDDRGDRGGWDRDRADRGSYERNNDGRDRNERGNFRDNRYTGQRWSSGWRQDRRYDWSGYRNSNRNAFRLPRYYAPGNWGYGYRRFGIGARLVGSLFASSYWIADPWAYRLPPAYGPYRWVRYYGDAMLVDVRSGYVVDVIHGIFW